MTTLSYRNVLVACAAVAMLGFAMPNVQHRAEAPATAEAASTIVPSVESPTLVAPTPDRLPPVDALPLQDASCGDGRCSAPEDCNTCPRDCGTCCGDRHCRPPEDCHSCPSDCGGC